MATKAIEGGVDMKRKGKKKLGKLKTSFKWPKWIEQQWFGSFKKHIESGQNLARKVITTKWSQQSLVGNLIKENEPKSMWATKSDVVTKTIKIQTLEPFTRKDMISKKVIWWALEVKAYFETQMIFTN